MLSALVTGVSFAPRVHAAAITPKTVVANATINKGAVENWKPLFAKRTIAVPAPKPAAESAASRRRFGPAELPAALTRWVAPINAQALSS